MVLSTWYVLAAFPLPTVSQLPGSNPHAASPATFPHLEVLCHICILISPLLSPKGLNCGSAVGGCSCPALSHTHPVGLIPGVSKAHSLPSPTQHLLVHNPCDPSTVPHLDFIACVGFPSPVAVL